MSINPDNFIFNSNFQYNNQRVNSSTPVLSSAGTAGGQPLLSGITDGDRYKVVVDDGTTVYQRGGPFASIEYWVDNGTLRATTNKSGGTFYYRVYDKSNIFNFYSKSTIERAVFYSSGTINIGGMPSVSIPNTYGKKMIMFAIWRNITHAPLLWYVDGQGSSYGTLGLSNTDSTITIRFGAMDTFVDIEYRIIGVPLLQDTDNPYIFNSNNTPLSIPYSTTKSMTSSSSLNANETRTTYSNWYDTVSGSVAMESTIINGNISRPSIFQDIILATNVSMTVSAEMNELNQVRIVIKEINNSSSYVSYTPKTISVIFNMNHMAIIK